MKTVLIAFFALILIGAAPGQPTSAKLGPIRAQLFYAGSGRLSGNVLEPGRKFIFWNTIVGEGDAEEPADDMLVTVSLTTPGSGVSEEREANLRDPVKLVAVDEKGKVLASRSFSRPFIGERGIAFLPLWLRDSTCWKTITVRADYKEQHSQAVLKLACGE